MSTNSGSGSGSTPRSAAGPLSNPPRRRGTSRRLRGVHGVPRPVALRSAGAPRDPEAEEALRRSLVRGLPKARRYHDPNRIEISLPPSFFPERGQAPIGLELTRLDQDDTHGGDMQQEGRGHISHVMHPPNPAAVLGAGRKSYSSSPLS